MNLKRTGRAKVLHIRPQQDLAAGLFMILLAGLALFLSRDLPTGTLRQIGPGMLPKTFAVLCAGLGLLLALTSLRHNGEKLAGWSWRGIIHVLGATALFSLAIRGVDLGPIKIPQLGLIVAGPLVVLISGVAADDRHIKELVVFAVIMTMFCALLFKYALGLPIPLAPWLVGI